MSSKLTKIQICEVVTGYKYCAYIYNEITEFLPLPSSFSTLCQGLKILVYINTCMQHTCTQIMFLLLFLSSSCTYAHLCAHMLLFISANTAFMSSSSYNQTIVIVSQLLALPVPSMLALIYPPNCFWSYLS